MRLFSAVPALALLASLSSHAAETVDAAQPEIVAETDAPSVADAFKPGALIDRKTGERMRTKCLDADCIRTVLVLLNREGVEIKQNDWLSREGDSAPKAIVKVLGPSLEAFAFVRFEADDIGVPLTLALLPVTAVFLSIDAVLLPYTIPSEIDWAITRSKVRKFERKKVKITHKRFRDLKEWLFSIYE
jgi:hypothetical protein